MEGAFRHGADVADGSHDEIVDDKGKDVEAQSRASLMHTRSRSDVYFRRIILHAWMHICSDQFVALLSDGR